MTTLITIFALLGGLAFGSFLNVCISRLPAHQSIVQPRSRCPHCQAPIRAWDNIPLLSFALLRGRCRHCHSAISWRYPLVEAAVAVLTVIAIRGSGLNVNGVASSLFLGLLVAMAACDVETLRLPDSLTLTTLGLGILYRAGDGLLAIPAHGAAYGLESAAMLALRASISALGAALLLLALRWCYWLLRRQDGMGLGDVKLAAAMAAWLGARQMGVALFLAALLGALAGMVLVALRKDQGVASLFRQPLPFGTFLSIAGIYCVFFGLPTLEWYLHFFP